MVPTSAQTPAISEHSTPTTWPGTRGRNWRLFLAPAIVVAVIVVAIHLATGPPPVHHAVFEPFYMHTVHGVLRSGGAPAAPIAGD